MQLPVEDFGQLGWGSGSHSGPSVPPEGSTSMTVGLGAAPSTETRKQNLQNLQNLL